MGVSETTKVKPWPTLQPPFNPSVALLCHPCITTVNLSYRFPIFETSATALCGSSWYMYNRHFCSHISIHFCRIHVKKQCMLHGFSFFCGRQKNNIFFWLVRWNWTYGIIHKDLDPWRKRKTSCMYTNTCFLHSGTQPNCVSHVFSVVFGLFFEFVHNKNRKQTRLQQV